MVDGHSQGIVFNEDVDVPFRKDLHGLPDQANWNGNATY